jgi:hypothetical protein
VEVVDFIPLPPENISVEKKEGVQVQAVLLINRKRPVIIETRRGRSA